MPVNMAAHSLRAVLVTFGKPVAYTAPGGQTITITGRFRQKPVEVDVGLEVRQKSVKATMLVATAGAEVAPAVAFPDGLEPEQDGVFGMAGRAYQVDEIEQRDSGGALCILTEIT